MIPGMSGDLPARRFGWRDMFVHPDDDPRTDGDLEGEVLVHMIEEYARHHGHADFLRERIDGRVGQ
jgi:hypothetical protein